jgi:hypothetical protein
MQSRNFPVFAPPGAKLTRTIVSNNTAATKTQLKAEKKAVKEKKAQADEEKKLVVAKCKLKAQAKKRKKAIAHAEARAQKAAAKRKPYKSNWHQSKPPMRHRELSQGTGELMFPRRARALGERWPC